MAKGNRVHRNGIRSGRLDSAFRLAAMGILAKLSARLCPTHARGNSAYAVSSSSQVWRTYTYPLAGCNT